MSGPNHPLTGNPNTPSPHTAPHPEMCLASHAWRLKGKRGVGRAIQWMPADAGLQFPWVFLDLKTAPFAQRSGPENPNSPRHQFLFEHPIASPWSHQVPGSRRHICNYHGVSQKGLERCTCSDQRPRGPSSALPLATDLRTPTGHPAPGPESPGTVELGWTSRLSQLPTIRMHLKCIPRPFS